MNECIARWFMNDLILHNFLSFYFCLFLFLLILLYEKIKKKKTQNYKKNILEVPLDVLAASITTTPTSHSGNKHKPYSNKNCCSGDDSIEMGMRLLMDQGKAEQVFNNPPIVRLLPSVIDTIIPNDTEDEDDHNTTAAAAQQYKYQP